MTTSTEYGEYIRIKRIDKGLTQAEVAKRVGISQVAYGRYELGTREPDLNMIFKIAKALDYPPGDFFNRYLK